MQKLCLENPYIGEFTAEIVNVVEKNEEYHIELDNTYFFPGSEVMPFDTGSINASKVTRVYEDNGKILHVVEVKPIKIHRVKCIIDMESRSDYMRQYLGIHILSMALSELFSVSIKSFNIGQISSYVEIDKNIESSDISLIDERINKIIDNNLNIETLYLTKAEAKKLIQKKLPAMQEERLRVIKIGTESIFVCSEMNLHSTIEARAIKITGITKNKTGSRIEFISGNRTVTDYLEKSQIINKISKLMSCEINSIEDRIEKLSSELKNANSERSSLKAEVADYEVKNIINSCEPVNDVRIIMKVHEFIDVKHINLLASKLTAFPNVIVLFGIKSDDSTLLLFMKSKNMKIISMNALLKDAISLIDGNGGGSEYSAKGGGKSNNNLVPCLEYAYKKVKESVMTL